MYNKKNIKILIIFFILSATFLIWKNGLYPVFPYTPPAIKNENVNVCNKIQSNEFRELCSKELENKSIDIEKYISLLSKYNITTGRCGNEFGSPGYCLSEEKLKTILNNKSSSLACNNLFANSESGTSEIPKSYCRALTKNPNFCDRIPLDLAEFSNADLQRRECYIDMAIIWKNSVLCEKLKDKEKDLCYLKFSTAKNNAK